MLYLKPNRKTTAIYDKRHHDNMSAFGAELLEKSLMVLFNSNNIFNFCFLWIFDWFVGMLIDLSISVRTAYLSNSYDKIKKQKYGMFDTGYECDTFVCGKSER